MEDLLEHNSDLSAKLMQIGDSIVYKLVQWTKRLPFYLELPVEVSTTTGVFVCRFWASDAVWRGVAKTPFHPLLFGYQTYKNVLSSNNKDIGPLTCILWKII